MGILKILYTPALLVSQFQSLIYPGFQKWLRGNVPR